MSTGGESSVQENKVNPIIKEIPECYKYDLTLQSCGESMRERTENI